MAMYWPSFITHEQPLESKNIMKSKQNGDP